MITQDKEPIKVGDHDYKSTEKPFTKGKAPPVITVQDRVANVTAFFLLILVVVASAVSIAAGASCLSSLNGKPFGHFPLLFAFGVAPVVFGAFCFLASVGAVVFIIFCTAGLRHYGMCCAGGTRAMKALNVCLLGVFPFLIFCVLFGLSLLGFVFFNLSRQLPPLEKDYTNVPGISGPVRILRDENGMVHIKANSRRDALFGQGFAEAQDRLFQMEFYRLIGRGELSSVVGSDGIEADKSTRILNIKESAKSLCALAKPSDMHLLQAFVDGVNYYLKHESKRPIEFFFMSLQWRPFTYHEPRPFSTDDLCVVMRLLQWQLSSNIGAEGERMAQLFTPLERTYEEVESLHNNFSAAEDTILTAEQLNLTAEDIERNIAKHKMSHTLESTTYNLVLSVIRSMGSKTKTESPKIEAPQIALQHSLEDLLTKRFFAKSEMDLFAIKYIHASNAWSARDSNNRAVGASDPHLPIELPSVWYAVHLSFPDETGAPYDAAGAGMAGVPGVHIGKTTYVSWGITMSLTDLEDLFVIADPNNPTQPPVNYTYRGNTYPFVPRRERIIVRGGDDIVMNLEDTLFGPVVNSLVGSGIIPPSIKLALYAVPLRHDDNESISSLLSLCDPTVKTAEELMTSLLTLRSPGFSIPIADSQGNLAYAVTGRHPLRSSGHTGKYPALSLLIGADTYVSDDPNVPDASVPPMSNPHFYSPADGKPMHISAANQKIYPEGYTYELGFDFAWAYRGQRLHELLNALQAEEGDQMANITRHMEIQLDIQSNIWVQDYRPIVAAMNLTSASDAAQEWQKRLLEWDARTEIGSQETAFFWRWLQSMSALPLDTRGSNPSSRYVWRMLTQSSEMMAKQCILYAKQLGLNSGLTTCQDLGRTLFVQLADTKFTDRWGIDLNILTAIHKLLHNKPPRPIFERSIQKDGDLSSICVSGNSVEGNMGSTQASSLRQLYDWSEPDYNYFILPGGNSGNPYSPYYQNLLDKFGHREYVRLAASHKGIEEMISDGTLRHKQALTP